jgi:hypothetical protein
MEVAEIMPAPQLSPEVPVGRRHDPLSNRASISQAPPNRIGAGICRLLSVESTKLKVHSLDRWTARSFPISSR